MSERKGECECECFGDSGVYASTHVPHGSDRPHCDLCGRPIPERCIPYEDRAAASTRSEADARRHRLINRLKQERNHAQLQCDYWKDEGNDLVAGHWAEACEALDTAIAALEREGELREALQHARVHSEDHSQRQNEEARCYRVVLAFDDPADAAAFLEARAALGGGHG